MQIGVIDDRGNFLHPNDILVLLYYYLLKYKGWRACRQKYLHHASAGSGGGRFRADLL